MAGAPLLLQQVSACPLWCVGGGRSLKGGCDGALGGHGGEAGGRWGEGDGSLALRPPCGPQTLVCVCARACVRVNEGVNGASSA